MSIHFKSFYPEAKLVRIAGSFNKWEPEDKNHDLEGNQCWNKEIHLLPGTYEYCLIVDGQWTHDPDAKDYIPNPYGGCNSVVDVCAPQDKK